jgi:hypothetical protein
MTNISSFDYVASLKVVSWHLASFPYSVTGGGAWSSWNLLALPIQGSYIRMHPNMGQSLVSLHSRLCEARYRNNSSITQGSNANHVSLNHANNHVFSIYYIQYLSSLWMSFKGRTHYGDEQLVFYVSY